jgi:hypothetical protein
MNRQSKHFAVIAASLVLAGCSNFTMPYIPYIHPAPPDMTPAHESAENLVRVDAGLRTGCDDAQIVDRPKDAGRSTAPQRWVVHTCRGELSYDVVTVQTDDGPVVRVSPVPSPIDKPMNPNTIPALPESTPAPEPTAPAAADAASTPAVAPMPASGS